MGDTAIAGRHIIHNRVHVQKFVAIQEKQFATLSTEHQQRLPFYLDHLRHITECANHNDEVIRAITADAENMFDSKPCDDDNNMDSSGDGNPSDDVVVVNGIVKQQAQPSSPTAAKKAILRVSTPDMDKVVTTLKQFVRDWAADGAAERAACYAPVVERLRVLFPPAQGGQGRPDVRVLVPGAGLGRLVWEVARSGFSCQGNEWSPYMLFGSHYVLNRIQPGQQLTLYPWLTQFCNVMSRADQVRGIEFPDVDIHSLPGDVDFSMVAGDFLEVYVDPDVWDCVATVFFIDTAHNILTYLETLWRIIKPGGYWINLGPLLYHYSGIPNELSIELAYEDLREQIIKQGFTIMTEENDVLSSYTQNPRSMLTYQYRSVFLVCQKPANVKADA